jgi:hypothetical protein
MKPDTLVQAFISSLTALQQELVGTPEEISDDSLISHLLANLSDTFKSVVDIITIRPSADETLDSVSTQLIEYETSNALRKAQIGSNPNTAGTVAEGHALVAEGGTHETHTRQQSGRGRGNGRGYGQGHRNRHQPYGSRPVSKCFYCLKEGHRQNECALKQKAEAFRKETLDGRRSQSSQISGNYAVTDDTDTVDNSTEMHAY